MTAMDDFMEKAKSFFDMAGRKTEETIEISKLKFTRMQVNNELQKSFEKLGSFTYKLKKTGEENSEIVDMCMKEIDELMSKLKDISNKIDEAKSLIRCPECNAYNTKEAVYCIRCGAKLDIND